MSTKKNLLPPPLGAHVSAAGGLYKVFDRAEEIGAEAIQIFGASPRSWSAPLPKAEEIKKFEERQKKSPVKDVYLHSSYLVNLASPSASLRAISQKNLAAHLKISESLNARGLIFHLGSGKDLPKEKALSFQAEGMRKVLKDAPGESLLIMENSAGGGQKLGFALSDLKDLLKEASDPRVKICFDTAHAFEAGLCTDYSPSGIKKFWDEWDKIIGIENLVVFHLNDSKTEAHSNHDRHENVGEGFIGLAGFKNLAKEKRLWHCPWLLEVPGFDNSGPDKKNIDILKSCFPDRNS